MPRSAEAEAKLVAGSAAVLTRRAPQAPFAALPHVDADGLPRLRARLDGAVGIAA